MAEISKQALKVANNTSFPNNNNGAITPAILRTFNVDMIDSLVDELGYNIDSASWNQQIDALEQYTASAGSGVTGSLLLTASAAGNVITFTKGNNTQFSITVATGSGGTTDLSQLNQATASLQAFTASANIKFANLESTTASLLVETQNLESFSASALVSISNLNASSASQQVSINALNSVTASYVTETESGSFLITASIASDILTFTKGNNTTFSLTLPTGSGGGALPAGVLSSSVTNFTDYSASVDNRINNIVAGTGFATTGSNTFVGSQTLVSSSINLTGTGQIILPNGFSLQGNANDIAQLASATTIQFITEGAAGPGGTNDIKFINRVSGSKIEFLNQQGGQGNSIDFEGGAMNIKLQAVSGSNGQIYLWNTPLLNGENTAFSASALQVNNNARINGSFTASLQQGYVSVGNASGITTTVSTSSFGGGGSDLTSLNAFTASQFVSNSYFATTGSNTFTAIQTINAGGMVVNNQYGFIAISKNAEGSGSQFPVHVATVDGNTYGADVFGGFQVINQDPNDINTYRTMIAAAATTYTAEVPSKLVGAIVGGGQNALGSDAALILLTGSADMIVAKPTTFNYNVNITGSLNVSSSLTASLQQGYLGRRCKW
jgi:hypothetical protein